MALAAQNMDGTSNEIDYQDIFGTIRAGKGDWDGSILIFILNVVNEFQYGSYYMTDIKLDWNRNQHFSCI